MHEISLVRTIFRTLEDQFSAEELTHLRAIDLSVGQLSNVEPVLLQNAFQAVTEEAEAARYRDAELRIAVLPAQIHCAACDQVSEVIAYRFVCSTCGRPSAHVVQGNELMITRVTFEEETAE
ncbi:MAG: hydrogenase maturation nickel metallochaperone HypA [Bacteroidia bacterium]|nr:hydrogenase maturation nickel metallochaperone HypA [Bacteroidia bacterium]